MSLRLLFHVLLFSWLKAVRSGFMSSQLEADVHNCVLSEVDEFLMPFHHSVPFVKSPWLSYTHHTSHSLSLYQKKKKIYNMYDQTKFGRDKRKHLFEPSLFLFPKMLLNESHGGALTTTTTKNLLRVESQISQEAFQRVCNYGFIR